MSSPLCPMTNPTYYCTGPPNLNPDSESASLWDCKPQPCQKVHMVPKKVDFWCVQLGVHRIPQVARGFKLRTGYLPFTPLGLRHGIKVDKPEQEYFVKLPDKSEAKCLYPIDVNTVIDGWGTYLVKNQGKNRDFFLLSDPPIMLFCTLEQARRCGKRGWVDSVRLEYELAHPVKAKQDILEAETAIHLCDCSSGQISLAKPVATLRTVPLSSIEDSSQPVQKGTRYDPILLD